METEVCNFLSSGEQYQEWIALVGIHCVFTFCDAASLSIYDAAL
jgi:hypothetical protein